MKELNAKAGNTFIVGDAVSDVGSSAEDLISKLETDCPSG